MFDQLTVSDIQIVRLQLQLLCGRQSDPAVRYYGAIVDFNLAQALVRDDPMLRAELANYVEEFDEALRRARLRNPGSQETDNTSAVDQRTSFGDEGRGTQTDIPNVA